MSGKKLMTGKFDKVTFSGRRYTSSLIGLVVYNPMVNSPVIV